MLKLEQIGTNLLPFMVKTFLQHPGLRRTELVRELNPIPRQFLRLLLFGHVLVNPYGSQLLIPSCHRMNA